MIFLEWIGLSTSSKFQPQLVINAPTQPDEKAKKLLERLSKEAFAEKFALESYSPNVLMDIKTSLILSKVDEEHPVVKKIASLISRHHPALSRHGEGVIGHSKEPRGLFLGGQGSADVVIENGRVQESLSLESWKSLISERGSELTELDLTEVDDELLQLVLQHCPQINALHIQPMTPGILEDFTDTGLVLIAQLAHLKSLRLDCWNAVHLSHEGWEKMMKSMPLKGSLEELIVVHPCISDAALSSLSSCTTLKALTLKGGWKLSTSGLERFLGSSYLRASMEKMHVVAGYDRRLIGISDAVLSSLSGYSKLQELKLEGDWLAAEQGILKFLEAQHKLLHLSLQGLAITDSMAERIARYNQLQALSLSDCSKLSLDGYINLMRHKSDLSHLQLEQAVELCNHPSSYRHPLEIISHLPKLSSLCLSGCTGIENDDFIQFCKSWWMKNNLIQLSLAGLTQVESAALAEISQLEKLAVLHIDNCPWFNADAMDAITQGKSRHNIQDLRLNKVAITDHSLAHLDRLSQLFKLTLGNCYALTEGERFEGREVLFDLKLKHQLVALALDNYNFSDRAAEWFANFKNLKLLWINNNSELTKDGIESLCQLGKNRGAGFKFVVEKRRNGSFYPEFDQALDNE